MLIVDQNYKAMSADIVGIKRELSHSHDDKQPNSLECGDCGEQFTSNVALTTHVRQVHKKRRSFKCDLCSKVYTIKDHLNQHRHTHIHEKHSDNVESGGVQEEDTAKQVESTKDKDSHGQMHNGETTFKCDHCSYRSKWKDNVAKHVESMQHKCDMCSKVFCTPSALNRHHRKHEIEKYYACEQCDYRSRWKVNLEKHVEGTHINLGPYKCDVCSEAFGTCDELMEHCRNHAEIKPDQLDELRHSDNCCESGGLQEEDTAKQVESTSSKDSHGQMHNGETIFKCDHCSYCSKWKDNVEKHTQSMHSNLLHKCARCSQTFRRPCDLKKHHLKHKVVKRYGGCKQCDFRSNWKANIKRHVQVTHINLGPYECEVCSEVFGTFDELMEHSENHDEEAPDQLDEFYLNCDKKERSKKGYKLSFKCKARRTLGRPYKCDVCSEAFGTCDELMEHCRKHCKAELDEAALDRHGKERMKKVRKKLGPQKCDFCSMSFDAPSTLAIHRRTHTGEKPYTCELCDHRCSSKQNLHKHIKRKHEKLCAYKCGMCDEAYSVKTELTKHRQRKHPGAKLDEFDLNCDEKERPKSEYRGPQKCDVCGRSFHCAAALARHYRTHTGEKPYKCEQCDHRSCRKRDIDEHVKRKHEKLRAYKCDICDKAYSVKAELTKHRQLKHNHETQKSTKLTTTTELETSSNPLNEHGKSPEMEQFGEVKVENNETHRFVECDGVKEENEDEDMESGTDEQLMDGVHVKQEKHEFDDLFYG